VKKLRLEVVLPFLWMFLAVARGVIFWRVPDLSSLSAEDYLAGSPIDRIAYLALMLLALAWMVADNARRTALRTALKSNRYLIFFYAYLCFSVVFSPFPLVSLKRFIKTFGTLTMVLLVWTSEHPRKSITELFSWYLGVTMLLSLLFIYLLPGVGTTLEWDGYTSWVGIASQKNTLGGLAGLSSLFFLWVLLNRERCVRPGVAVLLLALSLYLLAGSHSTTAQAIMAIGSVILVVRRAMRATTGRRAAAMVLLWLVALVLGVVMLRLAVGKPLPEYVVEGLGKDITLTGRTFLWAEVVRYALQRPLFGYGYGGFWIGDLGNDLWTTFTWRPNQAHNGYLDVFVQLGVVGSVLFVGLLIQTGAKIAAAMRNDQRLASFLLVLYVSCIITNFSESTFIRLNTLEWLLFLLVACWQPDPSTVGGVVPGVDSPVAADGSRSVLVR
jgi:exopolysaccharide production protein ExoQ